MAAIALNKPVSNIAAAFAAQSASSNIPINDVNHGPTGAHRGPLPTPPHSISPTLSAHKHRPGVPKMGRILSPESTDMDIDLQDAVEHAAAQDQPASALSKEALAGLEATRQITAIMLAKHHLPSIILGHGAMPIREMMAHLTQSVPGFSRLAPSKARRLVVAALEHRAGGGLHGEVKFEKVGWGRWSVAGQSNQNRGLPIGTHSSNEPTPPPSLDSNRGHYLPKNMRRTRDVYTGSWKASSPDSRDEEMADHMSLDDSHSDSSASDMELENDLNDDTDEEDWSAIGPEALRQKTRPTRPTRPGVYRDYNYLSRTFRSVSTQSVPLSHSHAARTTTPAFNTSSYTASRGYTTGNLTASYGVMGTGSANAEREAVEALIAMGSM
ncbi:hypothetical protein P280DRAFT_208129 [Massarina eburnea CBS 473.64]|uniref:Sin3 binding protein-domain-containing protein n=1 Tax=Massarina eburnea CBS 473.64 TaxID=1395130 RepID=A0A6A6RH84_9PLEO|nr:hypothetical protein P280DRAFT_208129 [Massarina eburnea CBS 473.64]